MKKTITQLLETIPRPYRAEWAEAVAVSGWTAEDLARALRQAAALARPERERRRAKANGGS